MLTARTIQGFLFAGVVCAAGWMIIQRSMPCAICTAKAPGKDSTAGVAVVELFTSEGCSSCPPAEQVVTDLNAAAVKDKRPVYALAFHVDYWDYLGWRDPFSDAAYSARQRDYVKSLHISNAYTPQMIVNGQAEFVGSDKQSADAAIAKALVAAVKVPVTLNLTSGDAKKRVFTVHFTAIGAGAGQVINFAMVEQGLSMDVKRGENAGKSLDQPSVVRWFKTSAAAADGSIEIHLPDGVNPEKSAVVAYVQRTDDGAVLGAAALPLGSGVK